MDCGEWRRRWNGRNRRTPPLATGDKSPFSGVGVRFVRVGSVADFREVLPDRL